MRFAEDPLINSIYQGIKRDIQVAYDNECHRACLILIYCGIDAMSYLDMPIDQAEVCRKDFIQWVEKYLSPNLKNSATQVTGEELYIARCALVHTYGVESQKTKSGGARVIGYMIGGGQSVVWDAPVTPNLILLRLETLRDAFFAAIDRFLVEGYADKQKQPILEIRMRNLLNIIPLTKLPDGKN